MVTDARISTGLADHPKTKKLIRRLGQAAGWNLVRLILWTAGNRPDGDLSGMTVEDLELSADWQGEEGAFVSALTDVRFLDGDDGAYRFHDWAEHNPWAAGSEKRSEKAAWAALCKQHGRLEAARMMPDYAQRMEQAYQQRESARSKDAHSMPGAVPEGATSTHVALPDSATGMQGAGSSSAPSPSPSPTPTLDTPLPPKGGARRKSSEEDPEGFAEWYELYQRKDARTAAVKAWRNLAPSPELQETMKAALRRWRWNPDREKNPHPATWINGRRWEDESVSARRSAVTPAAAGEVPWYVQAGFEHPAEAQNAECHIGNFREFSNGQRRQAELGVQA